MCTKQLKNIWYWYWSKSPAPIHLTQLINKPLLNGKTARRFSKWIFLIITNIFWRATLYPADHPHQAHHTRKLLCLTVLSFSATVSQNALWTLEHQYRANYNPELYTMETPPKKCVYNSVNLCNLFLKYVLLSHTVSILKKSVLDCLNTEDEDQVISIVHTLKHDLR